MERYVSSHLSIGTLVGALSLTVACSAGDADPGSGTPGSASSSVASSGSSSSSGSGSSGTGGGSSSSSGTGGSSAPSVCDNNVHDWPASGYVDNFETDVTFPGWYSFADTTTSQPIAREAGGAIMTMMGAHVSATGIKAPTAGGFGAGFGFGMKDASMACAGVSAFDGVSFWAKGTAGTDNSLRFQAVHPATQAKMDGGDCEMNCYNHPGKSITLTASWKQYTILWTELAGPVQVQGIILGINWITPGPDYDVWIDEVTLFAGTAPTGPVMP